MDDKQEKPKWRVGDGTPGPGRPKGSVNKVTAEAKQVIAQAAQMLGGVDRLYEWAKESAENEKAFWTSIYPKLLPLTVYGDAQNPLRVVTRVELVGISGDSTD